MIYTAVPMGLNDVACKSYVYLNCRSYGTQNAIFAQALQPMILIIQRSLRVSLFLQDRPSEVELGVFVAFGCFFDQAAGLGQFCGQTF